MLIWNLESSSLVNAVFGVVDFLEFLLGCTAHIFAQCCYLVWIMPTVFWASVLTPQTMR